MKLRDTEHTILVQSSNVDLGDALPEYARSSILQVTNKYIGTLNVASVHFGREGSLHRCTVNIQMSALRAMSGEAANKNAYTAFRNALAKVAKQLRRTKRELRDDKAQRIDKGIFIHQANRGDRQATPHLRGDAAELDRLIGAGSEQAPWKFRRDSAHSIAAE